MNDVVVYDVRSDLWGPIHCLLPIAIAIVAFLLLRATRGKGERAVISTTVGGLTIVMGVFISCLLVYQNLAVRASLSHGKTLLTCGKIEDLVKYGRGSEKFSVDKVVFVISSSSWIPGFRGPLIRSKLVLENPLVRIDYGYDAGGYPLILRLSVVLSC